MWSLLFKQAKAGPDQTLRRFSRAALGGRVGHQSWALGVGVHPLLTEPEPAFGTPCLAKGLHTIPSLAHNGTVREDAFICSKSSTFY